ncbi:MAG: hydroxymethylbilane synthase [Chthoniobacterales bacterium]
MSTTLRLATRGSDLALAQTREVARRLREAHPGLEVSEVIIRTTGDKDTESDLSQAAETGLFTNELEAALLDGRADAAVHSLKDLPTTLPSGLELAAVLPRADCSDVLVSMTPGGLEGLLYGARVGTGSPRRRAMLLAERADVLAVPIRGNVPTRLVKLARGECDATILAAAGLARLSHPTQGTLQIEGETLHLSKLEEFLPAPGQGAIAIEARSDDTATREMLSVLNDTVTDAATRAEREVLRACGGGCHMALGARAQMIGDELHLEAIFFDEVSGAPHYASGHGKDPEQLGREVAAKLHGQ